MVKLHLCCGDVYLQDYINIDVDGKLAFDCTQAEIDANKTTLVKYFKYPFGTPRRPIIVDRRLNLLEKWDYADNSIDEVVMISCFEHFEHHTELPHVLREVTRVLRPGGVYKFDFPNIKDAVLKYHDTNMQFCAELIYCNRKNKYSEHKWGYSPTSIPIYLPEKQWQLEFGDIVHHDYPMTGCLATKL
jgi:SAM-dependent methyltransferase